MAKICPKCGLEYPDADSFCIECGGGLQRRAIPKPAKIEAKPVKEFSELSKTINSVSRDIGALSNRVGSAEGGIRAIERDLAKLARIRIPVKGVESLRESMADGIKRIGAMSSRLERALERIRENENRINGIKETLIKVPRIEDIAALKKEFKESQGRVSAEQEGLVARTETLLRREFNKTAEEFISQFKERLDSSLQRVSDLEMQLVKLAENYDQRMDKKLEKFKVAFNRKVNNSMLDLRNEMEIKMGIINEMKKSLVSEIKLNQDRYAEYEKKIKKEIGDLENFKEGLNLQQQERVREIETQFLEKLGEIKDHTETIATEVFGKIGGELEKGVKLNSQDIIAMKLKLGRLAAFEKDVRRLARSEKELADRLEGRFAKEMEGLNNKGRMVIADFERRMKNGLKELQTRGGKEVRGLGGRIRSDVERNAERIEGLGRKLARVSYIEERFKNELRGLESLKLLQGRVDKILESVRSGGRKLMQEIREEALKDVQKNARGIQTLRNRVTMLSGLEKDLAEAILKLKETEAMQKGRVEKLKEQEERNKKHMDDTEKLTEDLILQQQHRLASLESRIVKALDNLKVYSRGISGDVEVKLIKRLGLNLKRVNELKKRMEKLAALEKSMEMHIEKNKGLGEDLVLQQQGRIAALELRIGESVNGIKRQGDTAVSALKKELGKRASVLDEKLNLMESFKQESRQQLDLMKKFMENLEKRVRLETGSLDGKLDAISKIQEKQELKILTPKRENINRVIKTQIKNEMGGLEERISRNILKKLK